MNFKYEVMVNKSFDDAIVSLKDSLSKHSFGVLWELNFKDKLREKGLSFESNFKILEVCNPKQAKEVLDKHLEVGYFLPCKIVVYEKNNSVYMGMIKPSELIALTVKEGSAETLQIAEDVEKVLKAAIDMAAK